MQTNAQTSHLEAFEAESRKVLLALSSDRVELKKRILAARDDEILFSYCEHYDILDKIVLYASDEVRIRLHIFGDGYFDRPHNHRWSYSSSILAGSYRHVIFTLAGSIENPDTTHLCPVLIRQEKAGDFYTLHHSQYHSVTAEPNTISLIYRGPAEANRFRVMDRATQESWWQYGAKQESAGEKNLKRMTKERFDLLVDKLHTLRII